jgi:hypothetical protein
MSGAPTSGSIRSAPPERRIDYRARAPGRRSSHSSRRSGEPTTGRRGTGDRITRMSRYARCETPKQFWESFIHRSLESCSRSKDSRAVRGGADGKVPERATRRRPTPLPVRFGRGRLDSLGNKGLAAYLIARLDTGAPQVYRDNLAAGLGRSDILSLARDVPTHPHPGSEHSRIIESENTLPSTIYR